jgi:hypothetical protein
MLYFLSKEAILSNRMKWRMTNVEARNNDEIRMTKEVLSLFVISSFAIQRQSGSDHSCFVIVFVRFSPAAS